MEPSIFTRIINGEIPCHKVYEDEKTFAFMDIHPVQPGMVLVVPKTEVENYEDLPEDEYIALMKTVQKIGKAQRRAYPGKRKMAVQIEGLEVPHVHVKVFPVDSGAEFHSPPNDGEPNHKELAKEAEKIKGNL